MRINDLIFKELIKRGFVLDGNTRIWNLADSKLWYLIPSQAQGFINISKQGGYKKSIYDKEIILFKKSIANIMKKLPGKSYNIIDLGCGDGSKSAVFIKELSKYIQVRYCPIDISSYMIEKALKTIKALKISKVIESQWNVSDFENLVNITPLLSEKQFKNHLLLLLGNTLGNFDRDDILCSIKKSIGKNDFIIIGNGLKTSKNKDILKPYQTKHLDSFLVKVVEQIGMSPNDVEYGVRFKNSKVEMFYTVKRDKTVSHLDKKIDFIKGDIIIIGISYKYTKKELRNNLKRFFSKVAIYTDAQRSYALAFCHY